MLTIYNTTVKVKDQAQADRLKQICIDYKLRIWEDKSAFKYSKKEKNYFYFDGTDFSVGWFDLEPFEEIITEQQFIELLKNTRL